MLREKKTNKKVESIISFFTKQEEAEKLYNAYSREFSSLTIESLRFYFEAARKGINFFKALLFEEIRRRDLRIGGLCQTRKFAVISSSSFTIEGEDKNLNAFIEDNFGRVKIKQMLCDLIEAQMQGFSCFQLFYTVENGKNYLADFSLVPNYITFFKNGINFIDFTKVKLHDIRLFGTQMNQIPPLIELAPEYYFEVYAFDGNEENGLLNGLIDSIIWGYFFKSYGLKDWSIFLERFAIPAIVGEYDPLMGKTDKDALWKAISNFGNLFKAMIPNTAKITPLSDNNKGTTGNLYENYLKYWNDELSIRILGQAMTTDTGQGGSYAKALVGNYVREDIAMGDRIFVEESMNELIKKIVDINFSEDKVKEYPKFKFVEGENLEQKNLKADILVKLKQAGFTVNEEEASRIFGMELRESFYEGESKPEGVIPEYAEKNAHKTGNSFRGSPEGGCAVPAAKKKELIDEMLLEFINL